MDKVQCLEYYSEPETEEHLNGKQDLYEWIKKQPGVTDAILEGWLPETKQRPDIMFKLNGEQYVIEYQCTPIATEYVERHDLYKAAGIKDIWIAGTEKYFSPNSRRKFLEDHIVGYYNPETKIYSPSSSSMYGKFYIKAVSKHLKLNAFIVDDSGIVLKSHIHKDPSSLFSLYDIKQNIRQKEPYATSPITDQMINRVESYTRTFNAIFKKKNPDAQHKKYSYVLYGNRDTWFRSKIFYTSDKKDFYKKLCELRRIQVAYVNLMNLFDDWNNDTWCFSVNFCKNQILTISIWLLHTFHSEVKLSYKKASSDERIIKQTLLPYMKACYNNALIGDDDIRVMEERTDE